MLSYLMYTDIANTNMQAADLCSGMIGKLWTLSWWMAFTFLMEIYYWTSLNRQINKKEYKDNNVKIFKKRLKWTAKAGS
jgi:cyanate permease